MLISFEKFYEELREEIQGSSCISERNVAFSRLLSQMQLLADGDGNIRTIRTHTICMTMGAILTYLFTYLLTYLLHRS